MLSMKKRKYSSCMLPNVNYRTLSSDFFDELTDLEYETQVCLRELTEAVKELFQKANMITIDEVMISHLSAYLGFMTVAGLGDKEAKILQDHLITLLTRESQDSYELFTQFPLTSKNNETRTNNLQKLRDIAPGSIVVQTIRLGRVMYDAMRELSYNRPFTYKKQTALFAPAMPFMFLLRYNTKQKLKELKKNGDETSALYHINHIAVQIGWLIGYFRHLGGDKVSQHLDYATGTMKTYINCGEKFLKVPLKRIKAFSNDFTQN